MYYRFIDNPKDDKAVLILGTGNVATFKLGKEGVEITCYSKSILELEPVNADNAFFKLADEKNHVIQTNLKNRSSKEAMNLALGWFPVDVKDIADMRVDNELFTVLFPHGIDWSNLYTLEDRLTITKIIDGMLACFNRRVFDEEKVERTVELDGWREKLVMRKNDSGDIKLTITCAEELEPEDKPEEFEYNQLDTSFNSDVSLQSTWSTATSVGKIIPVGKTVYWGPISGYKVDGSKTEDFSVKVTLTCPTPIGGVVEMLERTICTQLRDRGCSYMRHYYIEQIIEDGDMITIGYGT